MPAISKDVWLPWPSVCKTIRAREEHGCDAGEILGLGGVAKVKYDSRIAEHEIILKTIYKTLLNTDKCRQVGNHW